jgi:hypothetical protein
MSQQFGGDAVQITGTVTLANGVETAAGSGNFLNPPYGNCKVVVRGSCVITFGTNPTNYNVLLRRNPSSENVIVSQTGLLTAGAANGALLVLMTDGVDLVPDGRPCQYQLSLNCAGAGTNNVASKIVIEANMLSG